MFGLLFLTNASGDNIDGGVPVDLELPISQHPLVPSIDDYSSFYDFETISFYLSSAYF